LQIRSQCSGNAVRPGDFQLRQRLAQQHPDQHGERQRCNAGHLQQRFETADEGLPRQRRQGLVQLRVAQRVDERYQRCLARAGKR